MNATEPDRVPRHRIGAERTTGLFRKATSGDQRALARLLSRIENREIDRDELEMNLGVPSTHAQLIGITGSAGKTT